MAATTVTLEALTSGTTGGTGVLETILKTYKAFLEDEVRKGRITGPEYSTVVLGALESAGQLAVQFVLGREKTENEVCLLQAQYDLTLAQKDRTVEEKMLVTWKITTEKAQTMSVGVDADSVIGKQKTLYGAQADGFKRDAEQKATKILVDTWNVRRTTDEGTVADTINKLDDASLGRAVTALLAGIGA